ncbi:MAG: S8 family peptidase [Cyclobacteriaceae bacterium]|nr:S8 family peptidase [Cyclobacteriaceae bacterium]
MNRKYLSICMLMLISQGTWSQVNRYMVFYADKENSPYSVSQPAEFLSQRAIERRERFSIPVTVQDLPVNESYVGGVSDQGIDVFYQSRWLNAVLVQMDVSLLPAVEALTYVRKVEFVAPGERLLKMSSQKTGRNSGDTAARKNNLINEIQNNMLGVDLMHQDGFTGKNVMIGVFDAGFAGVNQSVYFNHLYDDNKLIAVRDFIRNSGDVYQYDDHGTGVLSTISGYEESVYEGIAFDADILLCVTEDVPSEYIIEEYNWLFAAEFADSTGVDIINTSLGYNTFDDISMNYDYDDLNGDRAIITQATDMAASRGILCVVSVGNEGNNSWKKLVAPADADSALSVGAVTTDLQYLGFSSTGPTADDRIKPDVAALGQGTKIIQYNGEISTGSGTSFASPLIAGLAAGLWEAYPELNNMEMIDLIRNGGSQFLQPDTLIGYGIPDYGRIRSFITALDEKSLSPEFRIYPNPVDNKKLIVEFFGDFLKESILIDIIDIKGSKVYELNTRFASQNRKIELDLSSIRKGVYVMDLLYGTYFLNTKLIIP